MQKIILEPAVSSIIKELAFDDISDLIKDSLGTEILAKISGFSEQVDHFEQKYNTELDLFRKDYEAGEEDFEKHDDLIAWKFAQQGKGYWQGKLEKVNHIGGVL